MKKKENKFQVPYLQKDSLKTVSIFVLILFLMLAAGFSILKVNAGIGCVLIFITGWLSWTFIEYFNHRFRMHGKGDPEKVIGYHMHIVHHHHPNDIKITIIQRILLLTGNLLLLGVAIVFKNWIFLVTGLYSGFMIYTLMHWFLHRKISAKLFPELHAFHIHHHCKHPDKCFGVTVTWWDHLFDTVPHEQKEITERIKKFYYHE